MPLQWMMHTYSVEQSVRHGASHLESQRGVTLDISKNLKYYGYI